MEHSLSELYDQLRATDDLETIAIVGKEGLRTTYTINLEFSRLVTLFKPVPYNADSKLLIQRETQKSRISKINHYLHDNYATFPSAGAIIERIEVNVRNGITYIKINKDVFRYLFDGQGRLLGIGEHLKKNPSIGDNTLTIKLYESLGLEADNQCFSDWNGSSTKPNASICQAMDSRALLNTYVKRTVSKLNLIYDRVDYQKASVPAQSKSNKLWSLNQFNGFVQLVLGVTAKSAEELLLDSVNQLKWSGFIERYFEMLSNFHPQIAKALSPEQCAIETRTDTIIGTSVWLKSMGVAGKVIALHLLQKGGKADWSFMEGIKEADFSRDNKEWLGRCMDFRGGLQDKPFNHKAMAVYMLDLIGIDLPEELEVIEEQVMNARASQLKAKRKQEQKDKQQAISFDDNADKAA